MGIPSIVFALFLAIFESDFLASSKAFSFKDIKQFKILFCSSIFSIYDEVSSREENSFEFNPSICSKRLKFVKSFISFNYFRS